MKIVVYGPGADAPPGHEFVAHIFHVENLPKKGPTTVALPVMIFGSPAERARERAEAHIAEYTKPKLPRGRRKVEAGSAPAEIEDLF